MQSTPSWTDGGARMSGRLKRRLVRFWGDAVLTMMLYGVWLSAPLRVMRKFIRVVLN